MKNLKKQILIKNQELVELFDNKIIDVDTNKIALFVSFSFHLLAMTIVIGIPSCFQPKVINVPNIIPIEILNVDEITRVPVNDEEEIKVEVEKTQRSKEVKFSSSEQTEIVKIEKKEEVEKDTLVEKYVEEKVPEMQIETKTKIEKKLETKELEYESLPTKKIKPKIKPKPEVDKSHDSDIVVKIKQKPRISFNISSVLKDLRQDKIQPVLDEEDQNEEKDSSESTSEKNSSNFTISEIDLLRQQLYKCWTVPAGAKGAKDMVVKVRVWVNPDRTVNNARILDTNRMQKEPYFRTVAESALRAVLNPACSPLKLPLDKYEVWKKFIFKFELAWMLGN